MRSKKMQRLIKHKETLVYYDSPQLFLASDQLDTQYLCLLVECTDEWDKFLCVPISPRRLKQLYRGEIDVRKIYETSHQLFYAEIGNEESIQLIPLPLHELSEELLPAPGFFLRSV
jgi:hypothetical protein